MQKLPKAIFVAIKMDGNEPYFIADNNECELVDMGEKQKIGVYKLVETREIEGVVKQKVLRR